MSRPHALFVVRKAASYPDIDDSLYRMVVDGTLRGGKLLEINIDRPDHALNESGAWEQVVRYVKDYRVDLVVLHHFASRSHALADPRPHLERLKKLPHRPLLALTNGDAFFNGLRGPSFPRMFKQASESVHVIASTSMGANADYLARHSGRPITLLPNGYAQAQFASSRFEHRLPAPDFKVVFIGSRNRPRNVFKRYHFLSRRRERLIRRLEGRFGQRFAVFGHGWDGFPSWRGPIGFGDQLRVCRRSELIVGGVPFSFLRYYTSDRVFNQIASGRPFVDRTVDGVEAILRDGEHWHLADSDEELVDRCDELLCTQSTARDEFGIEAARFVRSRHSVEVRCRTLVATLLAARTALEEGAELPPPDLRFLLPEVDRELEARLATRSWLGRMASDL